MVSCSRDQVSHKMRQRGPASHAWRSTATTQTFSQHPRLRRLFSFMYHTYRMQFLQSSMLGGYLQGAARREKRKQVPRDVAPKKWCPRCKKSKDSTDYCRDSSGAGGLHGYCKSCKAVRVAPKFKHGIVVYK
jgi:hypothetical protein